tara:strand:- start:365 stop:787 length:423 start_codon:yes stop_codon:yes gene_type:complete
MGLMKELNDLNGIYQKMYEGDGTYTVTAADKKANTPAWKGYKSGKKNVKTGKPLYKAADHLAKEELEIAKSLLESGKFTEDEVKDMLWQQFEEGYQRNPEKGEEEERKRSKRVPGERTPMPPRGDKKREEFERWYAANVR